LEPEEYPDPKKYPANEKIWVQTSERLIKTFLPEGYARISKEMMKTTNEVTFFKQSSGHSQQMTLGNELQFKQLNLVTYYGGKAYLLLFSANAMDFDRDLPYFEKTVRSFEFIGDYPIFDVFNNLGNIYFYEGKMQQSLRYFQAALKEQVRADLLNKVGIIYARLGKFKMAKEYFEEALKLLPTDDKIRFNLQNTSDHHYGGFEMDLK
ncbi:MAG: tetratricopeptide repeat protein, partial [Candidatus Wallbacteria bacterium]|nr:tetratricopeptide repeat protein [Candidatus Wallbacteria bacterium]